MVATEKRSVRPLLVLVSCEAGLREVTCMPSAVPGRLGGQVPWWTVAPVYLAHIRKSPLPL